MDLEIREYPYSKYVKLPGLSFGTGPSSKIVILTTLFRKNVNIGVKIFLTILFGKLSQSAYVFSCLVGKNHSKNH